MEANVLAQAFALTRYGDFTLAVTEILAVQLDAASLLAGSATSNHNAARFLPGINTGVSSAKDSR